MPDSLDDLTSQLRRFADDREWGAFHTPKNLAMALAAEAGELLEIFQWLTAEESFQVDEGERGEAVSEEIADILIYLVRLADVLGIDPVHAALEKVELNEDRFPNDRVRGRADIPPVDR